MIYFVHSFAIYLFQIDVILINKAIQRLQKSVQYGYTCTFV